MEVGGKEVDGEVEDESMLEGGKERGRQGGGRGAGGMEIIISLISHSQGTLHSQCNKSNDEKARK